MAATWPWIARGSFPAADGELRWFHGNPDLLAAFRAVGRCGTGQVVVARGALDHAAPEPQWLIAPIACGSSEWSMLFATTGWALD